MMPVYENNAVYKLEPRHRYRPVVPGTTKCQRLRLWLEHGANDMKLDIPAMILSCPDCSAVTTPSMVSAIVEASLVVPRRADMNMERKL